MSKHLFPTKSRSFKSCNVNQEEQKTKIKKHSFNISEAGNWRRIDALMDHPREEGTHMYRGGHQKMEVHQNSGSSDLDMFSSSNTQKLCQQPDTPK